MQGGSKCGGGVYWLVQINYQEKKKWGGGEGGVVLLNNDNPSLVCLLNVCNCKVHVHLTRKNLNFFKH